MPEAVLTFDRMDSSVISNAPHLLVPPAWVCLVKVACRVNTSLSYPAMISLPTKLLVVVPGELPLPPEAFHTDSGMNGLFDPVFTGAAGAGTGTAAGVVTATTGPTGPTDAVPVRAAIRLS